MARSLRQTTIIPPQLYVERTADRQLKNIIEEMGRPGYVLVARQMGKTNLLFNMKRRREREGDLVVYLDLSSRFESSRALFRFIIDSILEADVKLGNTIFMVEADRRSLDTEPNLEYDRHLRLILRQTNHKRVIIILDEVDSLISVPYSDSIFAQIRSMYFSRINYPEYHHLTYVLSGVAEPTDLIKDKNISPFNIGEKIYLDDFTSHEFKQLLSKASVKFSETVVDEIYNWTAGSPRMTWDVCAELEDIEIAGRSVTHDDVVAAVQKLYLTRFDRAPIDHIRVLVEADRQLSGAISSIRRGHGDALDERTKGRLYLAGISSANSDVPAIKNRIIDAALSDAWLAQVARSQKSLLELAAEHFAHDRFQQTIQLTLDHLKLQPEAAELGPLDSFQLGLAQYHEELFVDAITNLKKAARSAAGSELAVTSKFYIGSCMIKTQRFSEAITELSEVVDVVGEMQNAIRLALTSAYLGFNPKESLTTVETTGMFVVQELAAHYGGPASHQEDQELLASIYFNLAEAYYANQNFTSAIQYRRFALQAAPSIFKPTILLQTASDSRTPDDVVEAAVLAAATIIDERLTFSSKKRSSLAFNEEVLARTLVYLELGSRTECFDRLLSYAERVLFSNTRRPFSILIHLIESNHDEIKLLSPLVWVALDRYQDEIVTTRRKLDALRLAVGFADVARRKSAYERFCELIKASDRNTEVSEADVLLFLNSAFEQIQERNYQAALRSISIGRAITDRSRSFAFHEILLLRAEVQVYRTIRGLDKAKHLATILLQKIDEAISAGLALDSQSTLESVRNYANSIVSNPKDDPLRTIGRNQIVTVADAITGEARTSKFKFVNKDIREGNLILVSIEADK